MQTQTIHKDQNARQSDYHHLCRPQEVLVTKIFPTIQGEGPLVGQPAVFVRLAGCNLGEKDSCPWCDTDFRLNKGKNLPIADVLDQAERAYKNHIRNANKLMVLTGGEPLLQNPVDLLKAFLYNGWRVQIETNGYFWSDEMHILRSMWPRVSGAYDQFVVVVSPKVNQRGVYPMLAKGLPEDSDCLKILVENDRSSPYHTPPDYVYEYRRRTSKQVYVSPITHYLREPDEGPVTVWGLHSPLDHGRCAANHNYAALMAMRHGFTLSLQTHLFSAME